VDKPRPREAAQKPSRAVQDQAQDQVTVALDRHDNERVIGELDLLWAHRSVQLRFFAAFLLLNPVMWALWGSCCAPARQK